ncbi:Protein unc-45-like protein B, partial [Bienertia sinuspersici]
YIDDLDNLKELLEHIKEFKEDGNSFFNKGDIDSALEKYGFAGIFLTCIALEMEEDRETFINITSVNFTLQVSALFRRASAVMELGRLEYTFSDLELANVIDPSNQEVCKKLGEAKLSFLKEMEYLSKNPKADMRDAMLKVEPPLE